MRGCRLRVRGCELLGERHATEMDAARPAARRDHGVPGRTRPSSCGPCARTDTPYLMRGLAVWDGRLPAVTSNLIALDR
jgi:hypothetical protein